MSKSEPTKAKPQKPATKKPAAKKSAKATSKSGRFGTYFEESKDLGTSLILVMPLFVIYQIGILMTGGVRNGVDFVSDLMWLVSDGSLGIYLGINAAILAGFGITLAVLRNKGSWHPGLFPFIVLESTVYAMFLGTAVLQLMATLGLSPLLAAGSEGEYNLITKVVLSLGAGIYEETVFRLILMGGMFWVARKVMDIPAWMAAIAAVLLSSFIFSAIHYVGPLGDAFTLGSFLFRFFAGILLAAIFYLRGFAVAVYTHAIYDIIVMVFR
jgi:membrane protease YdiL (CAAX protease family)